MCGLFGFVSKTGQGPDLKRLAQIARATETRGPHAFGFAWLDSRLRLKMFKQTGRISDCLGLLALARDARLLVGHCRWATQGDPANNLNNHPHPCDGGWFVHNGMVHHYRQLVERHRLAPVTECDSEAIGLLVESSRQETMLRRVIDACRLAKSGPMAMLAVWHDRLIAHRSGNPLHLGETKHGWYLGSLAAGLPRGAYLLRDGATLEFREIDLVMEVAAYDSRETDPLPIRWPKGAT